MHSAPLFRFAGIFLVFIFALALSACNSGSSGDSSSTGSGKVAVLLTDGPADDFDQVNVTIRQIRLLSDEHGHVGIFEGNETVNLLDLRSHSTLFALADVPVGKYSKIRLIVDDIELVRIIGSDDKLNVPGDAKDETYHPKLPGNGKIDLNPRSSFSVMPGATLYLQLDMDAEKSIHVVGSGKDRYQFRPVVFVDIVTDRFAGKLVRVSGTVHDINAASGGFSLCSVRVMIMNRDAHDDRGHCMKVRSDEATSFFDKTGEPAAFGDLVSGEQATVIGRFDLSRHDEDNGEDDDDGDDVRHLDHDDYMTIKALVVELAPADVFKQVKGAVDSVSLSESQFNMTVGADQFVTADGLLVKLMPGVKVFSMNGSPLTEQDIMAGRPVKVEGILVLSNTVPDMIKAAVVFLGDVKPMAIVLSGPVTKIHDDLMGFDMTDTQLGDRCVKLGAGSDIYEISLLSGGGFGSSEVGIGDLSVAQTVTVYGETGTTGCVMADDVLAEGAGMPAPL